VIGGGDTGSDCIGTSVRQGALSITQLEILPQPPERENKALTWPDWPLKLRISSSQEEGCKRDWAVLTKRAIGENGRVTALECVRVDWLKSPEGRFVMQEVPDSTFTLKADLVLLAMGFLGPRRPGMVEQSGVEIDPRVMSTPARSTIALRSPSCSPPATCDAASRSSSGRSAKAANALAPSMNS